MPTKILSIDDSRMVQMIVARALKPFGIDVITAANGQEGYEKAVAEKPGFILLDATMPVLNGIEALEKLKADPATRDIPVMMLSADAAKDNIARALQLGAIKFIAKPFTSESLVEDIRSYLGIAA